MTFPMVVGLTGYAQHGKDTVGNRLVSDWGFERFAFADPLKSMALTLDPAIPIGLLTNDPVVAAMEAESIPVTPWVRLRSLVDRLGWEVAKKSIEVRRFLQVLGTEAVRGHLGDDSWVKATAKAIEDSGAERVVITDARFPNEFEFVRRGLVDVPRRGTLVRVTRLHPCQACIARTHYVGVEPCKTCGGSGLVEYDNGIGKDHPSEMHVASAPADFNIVAVSGQMDDLLAKADAVAEAVGAGGGY